MRADIDLMAGSLDARVKQLPARPLNERARVSEYHADRAVTPAISKPPDLARASDRPPRWLGLVKNAKSRDDRANRHRGMSDQLAMSAFANSIGWRLQPSSTDNPACSGAALFPGVSLS